MKKYNHKEIEKRIQEKWKEAEIFKTDFENQDKEKFYLLDMFPYPSGEGMHMGHVENYTITDTYYRYKRMRGFNVLHPQGLDAFGLPAENYAIKTGTHPLETTRVNGENYVRQWKSIGVGHDLSLIWEQTSSQPGFYKWTQSLFGKFFENDLVYKKTTKANWCPSCNTILANEQVEGGKCERCKTEIEQKDVPSWMFRITDFADDLIWNEENEKKFGKIDWPEHTKKNQNAWIGKSVGAKIKFDIVFKKDSGSENFSESNNDQHIPRDSASVQRSSATSVEVFTTRPDTLFGATYMVLAPEHSLVQEWKDKIENWEEVEKYIEDTKKKTELDRLEGKEKTGVELKGVKAVNPANQEELPIFISDYVLAGYGTGAIMAVPAHDERDYEFAAKYNENISPQNDAELTRKDAEKIEIKQVIDCGELPCPEKGKLVNSGQFDEMDSEEAKEKITEFVGGEMTATYRLRDWSISRQRYWGTPIPIVYNPEGKAHFVGEENLPWKLPTDVDFVPTGEAPLAKSKELKERVERIFGEGWTPEVDTMDTFVDSSWYFLRYPDPNNENEFASQERLKKWMPVDLYIGGAEHTYMHLLYARFFTHAMHKMGLIDFSEPFLKLRHQGMILDKKGKKMSKSKGNVVNPDEMVERFGADATRAYMLFAGPIEDDKMWNEDNIVGIYRWIEKIWRQQEKLVEDSGSAVVAGRSEGGSPGVVENQRGLAFKKELHKTIKSVTENIENLRFNVAISDMMKLMNFADREKEINKNDFIDFIKILSPFVPHTAEEIFENLVGEGFLVEKEWPSFDEELAKDDLISLAVQVNGKKRGEIEVSPEASEDEVVNASKENPEIAKWLEGEIVKVIYVPGRILNFVIK